MLSASKLRDYASLRGLSVRDIEAYCDLSAGHISNIFNGERSLTEECHKQIADAINAAYSAKQNGTFKRQPLDANKNAIKKAPEEGSALKKPDVDPNPRKKRITKGGDRHIVFLNTLESDKPNKKRGRPKKE